MRRFGCVAMWVVVLTLSSSLVSAADSLRVIDGEGRPVSGAVLKITVADRDTIVKLSTDAQGRVELPGIVSGTCDVVVTAEGYESRKTVLVVDAVPQPNIVLRRIRFTQRILVSATLPDLTMERSIPAERLNSPGSTDLADALRGEPALAASRRGAINLDPTVRGLAETQVGVFVNGTRTFAAGPARMDSGLSHVSLRAVESARVVKGPYALAWGSGTLSAIQVETYKPAYRAGGFRTEGQAAVTYASNGDTTDVLGAVGGSGDRFRFNVSANLRSADDYEDGDGTTVPGDYRSTELRWGLGLRASDSVELGYEGGYQSQQDLDYPGRLLDATYFYARSHDLRADWTPSGGGFVLSGQVYVNDKAHRMNNDAKPTAQPDPMRMPPFGIDVDLPTRSETRGASVRASLTNGSWNWNLGSDYYHLDQTATRTISNRATGTVVFEDVVWPDAVIEDLGLYAQAVRPGANGGMAATLRVDFVDASAGTTSPFFQMNTSDATDQAETNFSAAVSGHRQLNAHWTLTAGVGRAVRTATVLERYSDRFPSSRFQTSAEFMGQPGLEPETSTELDVGLQAEFDRSTLSVDAFYRVLDDYINVRIDPSLSPRLPLSPPAVYRYFNSGEARFVGGEASFRQEMGGGVEARASVSYVRAEDSFYDEPVFGIAPLWGDLSLRYNGGGSRRYWVEVGARVVDRQDRVAIARMEVETPGYTVSRIAAGWSAGNGLSLRGGVDNLSDKTYSDHLDTLDPFSGRRIRETGRRAHLELGYRF